MIVPPLPVDKAQVAARYDALDRLRRDLPGEHLHHGLFESGTEPTELAQKNLVVKVAEAALLRPGKRVVDVGCGSGAAARVLAQDYACDVVGFTISPAEHARAVAATTRQNPRVVLGDFLQNDLEDDAYDAVIAIDAADHFTDRLGLYKEALRVLKPGGRFVIAGPLACDRPWRWETAALLRPICVESQLPALLDEGEQKRLLWDAGFDVKPVVDFTGKVAKTWPGVLRAAFGRRAELDRGILKATARVWVAEALRTMRYGMAVAVKRTPKA